LREPNSSSKPHGETAAMDIASTFPLDGQS
jgi:hypothetical protein